MADQTREFLNKGKANQDDRDMRNQDIILPTKSTAANISSFNTAPNMGITEALKTRPRKTRSKRARRNENNTQTQQFYKLQLEPSELEYLSDNF